MFNFIKRNTNTNANLGVPAPEKDEKEKRKKEKKERKEKEKKEKSTMSTDDLLRLDEVRKSLKLRVKRKEKGKLPSGITADYSANFLADIDRVPEDSSEQSDGFSQMQRRPLPPLPPKLSKGFRYSAGDIEDKFKNDDCVDYINNMETNKDLTTSHFSNPRIYVSKGTPDSEIASASVGSLTEDESTASFATPPCSNSPIGEGQGRYGKLANAIINMKDEVLTILPLPELKDIPGVKTREVILSKGAGNDFGLSVKQILTVKRGGNHSSKLVILVECGDRSVGLFPGERLLRINGNNVDDKTREEIVDLIKASGDTVLLEVEPVPELSELGWKFYPDGSSMGPQNHFKMVDGGENVKSTRGKSDEQLENEKSWLDQERLWLMHSGGITEIRLKKRLPDVGKLEIALEGTSEEATIDEDDAELANPKQFDHIDDLCQLRFLNESSCLHTLRQRFGSNLVHTYAGPAMIIINPMIPLSIYSDKVEEMYRSLNSENAPPHVFSLAQSSYRSMLSNRRDHTIALLGRSGSGKSANCRHILRYFSRFVSPSNSALCRSTFDAIFTLLEAFGNAKTALNHNATKFTHLFSLDFDHSGQIASASLQLFSCDKWRIVQKCQNENTFHVIYTLFAGVEGNLRKELLLDQMPLSERNSFFIPLQNQEDKQKASVDFGNMCAAFETVGISTIESRAVLQILAGIIHLGYAGVCKSNASGKWQFSHAISAQRAAKCLGTTMEELARVIFTYGPSTPTNSRYRSSPTGSDKGDEQSAADGLEALAVGLYVEAFNLVGSLINRCIINASTHTVSSILLLDYPGFQNTATCSKNEAAGFSEFCYNYLHERMQALFHYACLDMPRDKYSQECVQVDKGSEMKSGGEFSPQQIVQLYDAASNYNRGSPGKGPVPGLFSMLEEAALSNGETYFGDKVSHFHGDKGSSALISKVGHNQFVIQHCQGTNPVLYCTDGWIKKCKEHGAMKAASILLRESADKEIAQLFAKNGGCGLTGSVSTLDVNSHSLRRISSIRRTFTGSKRKSAALHMKFTADGLIETLRRTKVNFAHCVLPQHNAGLVGQCRNDATSAADINVPLLRSQFRGAEILPVVRLHKQGFPTAMPLSEFRRRFSVLITSAVVGDALEDDATAVQHILLDSDVDSSSYRLGLSQIFLRSGVLTRLGDLRNDKIGNLVVNFQAYCRGYLRREQLAKLKVKDAAIRCVQRNVRKFEVVRNWPWWKLYVRLIPLLNVHRTEQDLKAKTDELESLKMQCQRLERERNALRQENATLDSKLSEVSADLAEERSALTVTCERLEMETGERIKLENELKLVTEDNKKLQENGEKMEMELLCVRSTEGTNGMLSALEEDEQSCSSLGDDTSTAAVYKRKYERVARELEFAKRRLQQQHHDDLEQLIGLRKQLEKKICDAYEEVEEQRQVVAQWKRKVQKLNGEMSDLRLMLEESNSRNNLLEKKQRKFDTELSHLQEELRQERNNKEKACREREQALSEKYQLDQKVNTLKMDLEMKEQKIGLLTRELSDVEFGGSVEEEVAKLRKAKHDLAERLADQEEELDDLSGQVQLLEQAKLRLEMNLEQCRKEHKKELAQREEEIEEVRCNATKKVKALECQLENEHEERTVLLRERNELERRLVDVQDRERCSRTADMDVVQKLKRDLKKTKVLLQDAQLMVQQHRKDGPNKAALRQLRNQLEDVECARNAAVKAKQLMEADLMDATSSLEEVQRAKSEAEERASAYGRERAQLQSQLDENEEELAEVMKKYRAVVQQLSNEQLTLHEQASHIADLESERAALKDQLAEMTSRLENMESQGDPASCLVVKRLELKNKELESRLDLEQTTKSRMEVQIGRLKEAMERLQGDAANVRGKESAAQESARKLQRVLRETREALNVLESKEASEATKKKDLEKKMEQLEVELVSSKADLKLALQRIDDLQSAIQGELDEEEDDDEDQSDSDNEGSTSDTSLQSYLTQNTNRVSIDRWLNTGPNNYKS